MNTSPSPCCRSPRTRLHVGVFAAAYAAAVWVTAFSSSGSMSDSSSASCPAVATALLVPVGALTKRKFPSGMTERPSSRVFATGPDEGKNKGEAGGKDSGDSDESNDVDYDSVRRSLEGMIGPTNGTRGKQQRGTWPSSLGRIGRSKPPPMTKREREFRRKEISLLKSLKTDNDALAGLWDLWFNERGPAPATELIEAEDLLNRGPRYWERAEEAYRTIIDKHGVHWAEPVNRLATLMYMQGRLGESRGLCELVLSVKPWHFGALSGIVMVFSGLNDTVNGRIWADRRLPPLQPSGDNERREIWVKRAVVDATRMLLKPYEVMDDKGDEDERESERGRDDNDPYGFGGEFKDAWQ